MGLPDFGGAKLRAPLMALLAGALPGLPILASESSTGGEGSMIMGSGELGLRGSFRWVLLARGEGEGLGSEGLEVGAGGGLAEETGVDFEAAMGEGVGALVVEGVGRVRPVLRRAHSANSSKRIWPPPLASASTKAEDASSTCRPQVRSLGMLFLNSSKLMRRSSEA